MKIEIYTANYSTPNIHSRKPFAFDVASHQEAWETIQAYGLVLATQSKYVASVYINGNRLEPKEVKEYLIEREKALTRLATVIDEFVDWAALQGYGDIFEDFIEKLIDDMRREYET